jgi:acyl-CoA synthetase (AMP-forming)/AMP-acid ligase II
MCIVSPEGGLTVCPDGESGELQVCGLVVCVRYYNNIQATESLFVDGGRYHTGDIGIIQDGSLRLSGRIKETVIVHGVSCGIPELKAHLYTMKGVTHPFLAAAPYCAPGQQTECCAIFYSPSFDFNGEDASIKLSATQSAIRDTR